jgi:hypothetical protein
VSTGQQFGEYARECLEAALFGLTNNGSDAVLGEAQAALMALHMLYGSTGTITLVPGDIMDDVDRPEPVCICPPDLVARGGFRSGCPAEHPWPPRDQVGEDQPDQPQQQRRRST